MKAEKDYEAVLQPICALDPDRDSSETALDALTSLGPPIFAELHHMGRWSKVEIGSFIKKLFILRHSLA